MATGIQSRDRAISPVIGIVLLVAIVSILAAVAGGMFFELTREREPAPEITLSLEGDGAALGERWLVHDHGERLDGDKTEIRGIADPETLSGESLSAADRHRVVPVSETIRVVWFGEHGTSYVIREFSVEPEVTVPSPDEGCPWVDTESNGGVDDVKVDGIVVDCDIETDKVVEIQNGGVVLGDTESHTKLVDADDARLFGDVVVEKDVNLQNGTITGSVEAQTENVKIDDGTVGKSIQADKTVEVVDGSSVGGDAVSANKQVKVLSSSVSGHVATNGSVKLQDATVGGDVYVAGSNFDCTNSTVNGKDCGNYSPRDPGDY